MNLKFLYSAVSFSARKRSLKNIYIYIYICMNTDCAEKKKGAERLFYEK